MELDEVCGDFMRGSDMAEVRLDEQAHGNSSVMQHPDDLLEAVFMSGDVEPALRREFLAFFRDKCDQIRLDCQCDLSHRLVRRHFHVELRPDQFAEQAKVAVLDVPAILPQMHDDAVCAGQLDQHRRGERVRIVSATRLPQCSDVIDIYTESGHKEPPVDSGDGGSRLNEDRADAAVVTESR